MQNLIIELRPTDFSQVIGNKEVIAALKSQLESGRVPTAFLFSGASGHGKTTLSEILAREVQGADFTDTPEVRRLNAADTNGVDDMRELVSRTDYLPMTGKYRVIIIDEAQQLTTQAQQVLLIPMEKVNSPTIFIICTTDPQKLLPTLKNRCTSYQLKGLTRTEREELVTKVLDILHSFEDQNLLLSAMDSVGMVSPRDVVNAAEKYANGLSADICVHNIESDSELTTLCSVVMSGKWTSVSPLLKNIKPSQSKDLRNLLSSYMRSKMFSFPSDTLANTLREFALYQTMELGCDLGALTGIIWSYCKKMGGC